MLAGFLTAALLTLAALATGQAAMSLCGSRRPSVLAPAAGLSLLLIVANVAIKLPGRATVAWIGLAALLAAAVAVLVARRADLVVGPWWPAALAVVLAAFAVSIPFLVNGRIGPLGAGLVNDDMASHLLFTEWLVTHAGVEPDQVAGGYPLGPHALVAAVSKLTGASLEAVFAGLTIAIAALTALTAYGALENVRPWLRAPGAALVALPYLGAAYLAQGAFKEPLLALFLLAFALALREIGSGWRSAVPAGLIAAGTLYAYSFPGLAWLAGALVAWAAIELWWRRREAGELLRRALPAASVALAILLAAAIPEASRLIDFTSYNAFDPEDVGTRVGLGNLREAISPLEAFNVWPSADYRVNAANASLPGPLLYLGALLGAAALAWGLLAAWSRRESALIAAAASAAAGYLAAATVGTPYTSAKALAIAAPIAMLVTLRGLLAPATAVDGSPEGAATAPVNPRIKNQQVEKQARSPEPDADFVGQATHLPATLLQRLGPLRIPLAIVFVIGAALSSFLPLRAGAVGPSDHGDQLRTFKDEIDGRRVLFLGREQYVAYELKDSKVATPILNYYNQKSIGNRFPPTEGETVKLDFDAVSPELLDFYAFAITTKAGYQSAAPPNFRRAAESDDYVLWERVGPTPPRTTLAEPNGPGAILDCASPEGGQAAADGGRANVFIAPPVVGTEAGWMPSSRVTDARPASQSLELPAGRWSISIQYVSTQDLRLEAPGLDASLPPNLDFRGPSPFWPAGVLELSEAGPVRFTASVERPSLFGRMIGAEALAFPLAIAASPAPAAGESAFAGERRLPVARACGSYLDFVEPAGAP